MSRSTLRHALRAGALCLTATSTAAVVPAVADAHIGVTTKRLNVQTGSRVTEHSGNRDRVADSGVTELERERALGQLGGAAALALEDSDTRMNRLGRAELSTGEFVDLDASLARLGLVGLDDVRDLARGLRSGPLSTVVVGDVDGSSFTPPTTTSAAVTP